MWWVVIRQIKHCKFANPIRQWNKPGNIEYLGRNKRPNLQIPGETAGFNGLWSMSCYPPQCWANVIMTDLSQYICQSHLAIKTVWVILSTWVRIFMRMTLLLLAYDRCPGVLVNLGNIDMTDPVQTICQSLLAIKTVSAILSTGVRMWDMGSLFRVKAVAFAGIS